MSAPSVACPQGLPLSFCSSGLALCRAHPRTPCSSCCKGGKYRGQTVPMDRQSLCSVSMQAHCFHQAGTKFVFLIDLHVLQMPPQGPGFRQWLANPQPFLSPHQAPCPPLSRAPLLGASGPGLVLLLIVSKMQNYCWHVSLYRISHT